MRKFRSFTWLFFILLAAVAPFFAFQEIGVDVAPLAEIWVDGEPARLTPEASLTFASPTAVNDGLIDSEHMFRLPRPRRGDEIDIELRFPSPFDVRRLIAIGWGDQKPVEMIYQAGMSSSAPLTLQRTWEANGIAAPTFDSDGVGALDRLKVSFLGDETVVLNSLSAYVLWPRWKGWALALGLNVALPWTVGMTLLASALGWGQIATMGRLSNRAAHCVIGLTVLCGFSLAWVVLPRHDVVSYGFVAAVAVGVVSKLLHRLSRPASNEEQRGLFGWLSGITLLLLFQTLCSSYVMNSERIVPVDHLLPLLGAERLSEQAPIPPDLTYRPWMLHVLYAPLAQLTGGYRYWCYLGVMAALNSLMFLAIVEAAKRWNPDQRRLIAAAVCLMPMLCVFHVVGQRPFSAALAILALCWQLSADKRYWLLGGLSMALAIGAHPAPLFLLPGAAVYWFLTERGLARLWSPAVRLALPVGAYFLWGAFVRQWFPDLRNPLQYYPLMTDLEHSFPPDASLFQILASIDAQHWTTLISHRLGHLRYYVWAGAGERAADLFRTVSLTSLYGVFAFVTLLRKKTWTLDKRLLWIGVIAPLIVHHLHIGQADAQFHISPTPFFLLGGMMIATSLEPGARFWRWAMSAAVVEWFARTLFPLMTSLFDSDVRGRDGLEVLNIFGGDGVAFALLAVGLPACWLALASRASRYVD